MKNFLNRVKATKGMSGVLVALLLVIVGVGLVAGVNTYMKSAVNTVTIGANTAIDSAINAAK